MIARSPGLRLARAEASRLAGARIRRRRCCGQPPGNVGDNRRQFAEGARRERLAHPLVELAGLT